MSKPLVADDVALDTPLHMLPLIVRELGMTEWEQLQLLANFKLVSVKEVSNAKDAVRSGNQPMAVQNLIASVVQDIEYTSKSITTDLMMGLSRNLLDITKVPMDDVSARTIYNQLRMLVMVVARQQTDADVVGARLPSCRPKV